MRNFLFLFSFFWITQINAASRFELMGLDKNRAQLNYMLNCQGCHAGDGRGLGDVPALKGFVGNFLSSNEGRAYLIRVPGSANSPLTDVELAEVVNWILVTMSDKSLADSFNPLTPEEVQTYRGQPILDAKAERSRLIAKLPIREKLAH